MKKILSIILSIGLIFGLTGFQMDNSYAAVGDKIVVEIDVHAGDHSDAHIARGHSLNLIAKLYDANGNLVTGDDADMDWKVTHVDGGSCHAFTSSKISAYEGMGVISHGYVHVPYTEHAHSIKLVITSKTDPSISVTKVYKITNSKYEKHHTFFYYVKGHHHNITGNAPVVKETWDEISQTYTMIVPKNTFKRPGYKLKYWMDDYGAKYKPGDTITHHRKKHGRMTAVWTKKTYKEIGRVKAYVKSGTSIKVRWGKVQDATGYNIYRYSSAKQKYVKIKKITNGNTTSWVNKKLKKNRIYNYKVQAIKTVGGKEVKEELSSYARAVTGSSKRCNVKEVILNKESVNISIGSTAKLRAKVKYNKEKKVISKSIRWFTSNEKVATVSKKGVITGVAEGKCYIYAKAHNGKNGKRVEVIVK